MGPNPPTLRWMQRRVARESIGPSTLRKSLTGTAEQAQLYLANLDLEAFRQAAGVNYAEAHLGVVGGLQDCLRDRGLSSQWGRCAKATDVFIRSVVVHAHLRDAYDLGMLEAELYVPLDSKTMGALNMHAKPRLPNVGVLDVTLEIHAGFQAVALLVAQQKGILRIWLDDLYWPASAASALEPL